jgi:hypothetical protein
MIYKQYPNASAYNHWPKGNLAIGIQYCMNTVPIVIITIDASNTICYHTLSI